MKLLKFINDVKYPLIISVITLLLNIIILLKYQENTKFLIYKSDSSTIIRDSNGFIVEKSDGYINGENILLKNHENESGLSR